MTILFTLGFILLLGAVGLVLSFLMTLIGVDKIFYGLYQKGFLAMKAPVFVGLILAFWAIVGIVPAKSLLIDDEILLDPEEEAKPIEEVPQKEIQISKAPTVEETAKFKPDFSKEKRVYLTDLESGNELAGKHIKTSLQYGKIDDREIIYGDKGILFPAKIRGVKNHPDAELWAFFPSTGEQLNELRDFITYQDPTAYWNTNPEKFFIMDQEGKKIAFQLNAESLPLSGDKNVMSLQGLIKFMLESKDPDELRQSKAIVQEWQNLGLIQL